MSEGVRSSAPNGPVPVPTPPFTLGRLPRIEFGLGAVARVPAIVAGHGRRVLLVTGGRSLAASGRRETLLAGLRLAGVEVVGEVTVTGEPSPALVDEAVESHRGGGVDVVLGIGGGSALDAAKAIAGLLRTGTSVLDHLEGLARQLPYPGPAVPLVAVPTTAGTGSEATRNAVLTERGPQGFKRSFRDERLVPADAVVDPDLLAGSGRELIAANGLDAVTQLLESYVSLRAAPITDALALDGLAATRDGLIAWHNEPNGPNAPAARARMAYAALLSGICLANAGLGAVHGLAAALGARFPIPHGIACGATLAAATAANVTALEARDPGSPALARYAVLGRLLADLPADVGDEPARAALIATIDRWSATLAVPRLGSFGLDEADIAAVVADSRGSSMRTNPVVLDDAELTGILRRSR